jgi:uncharacterized membrane protein
MQTPKERYNSNLNFAVVTFFILVSLASGYYIGLITSKGGIIETNSGVNVIYQNVWLYRSDIFNLLLIAIAYVFVVLMALVILGRFNLNKDKKEDLNNLERLGDLYKKGILTKEEFDKKKGELLETEEN